MHSFRYFSCASAVLVLILLMAAISGCTTVPSQEAMDGAAVAASPAKPPEAAPSTAPSNSNPNLNVAKAVKEPVPMVPAPIPAVTEMGPITDKPAVKLLDLTVTPDDLWTRIRRGFAMPDLDSTLVHDREESYVAQAAYFERIVSRGKLYLYHIVDELESRGMPTELALLPIVESAFNPAANSPAHASGLWQFIPSTGKRYNLTQTRWYDARRDIIASTDAALDYLEYLYKMHGDWQLALASYNWGENAVARAIEKNRAQNLPTDYINLDMPQETRYYVPKLQALKNIILNPGAFGIDLDRIPNEPYFATVKVRDMDMSLAAKLAGMSVRDLIALNPGHKRPVISAAASKTLVLPVDRVHIFETNLARQSQPLVSWQTYRLKRSDRLERLAAQRGISMAQLMQVNDIARRSEIKPGMEIYLPVKNASSEHASVERKLSTSHPIAASARKQRRTAYRVKRGETLSGIARRYDVSVDALRSWNKVRNVRAGQNLVIYEQAASE
jgi:membrane-bound lytic murein transglycosylase D